MSKHIENLGRKIFQFFPLRTSNIPANIMIDTTSLIKYFYEDRMIPGINKVAKNLDDEKMNSQMKKSEAIILSMTEYERENPSCLKASRKNRIAKGAGVDIADVNRMVKQFNESRKMMKKLPGMMGGKGGKRGKFKLPF